MGSRPPLTPEIVGALTEAVPKRAFAVWVSLYSRARRVDSKAWPAVRTIAKDANVRTENVCKDINRLEAAGWLRVERSTAGNQYWLTIPQKVSLETTTSPPEGVPPNDNTQKDCCPAKRQQGVPPNDSKVSRQTTTEPIKNQLGTKKEPASAGAVPEGLLELINGWSKLPPGIVKPGNGARSNPPSKAALSGWKKAQKEPEQREAFVDIPALLEAIKRAKFCHGKDWFEVPWLFGKNKNLQFNVVKILNGGHDNDGNDGKGKSVRQASSVARPSQRYGD